MEDARAWWSESFRQVQNTLLAVQSLSQSTAKNHQRFLEGQQAAQKTFQLMVDSQRLLLEGLLTNVPAMGHASRLESKVEADLAVRERPAPLPSLPAAPQPPQPPSTARKRRNLLPEAFQDHPVVFCFG